MSEISKALDKSRREQGFQGGTEAGSSPGPVVSPVSATRIRHWDAEQYLALASEIALAIPDQKNRVVVFASAVGGEGTSTIAREFAATIAERGEICTVLIDANLRSPSVHRSFRVRRDPGLTDHVLGGARLDECIRDAKMPRLSVLPCGRPVIAPPRVAADERVGRMLSELRNRYRFVVLDSPPILTYSEAVQISAVGDGVVTIVRAGHTRRQLHAHALDQLDEAGANVLGTVLNRRRFYIPKFVYDRM